MIRHEILINSEKFVIVSPEVLNLDEISMLISCGITNIESVLITHQDDEPTDEEITNTGHWITNSPQYDMLNPQYICSECGNAHTRTTPYCEMCGAKMEVGEK